MGAILNFSYLDSAVLTDYLDVLDDIVFVVSERNVINKNKRLF